MKYWKKLTHQEQDTRVSAALQQNIDFSHNISLGVPVSRLDPEVFHDRASFLKEAPLLRAYVQNPNHIGCHTMGSSEPFFKGTQALEQEVIELLATDLLGAEELSCDGYIAQGGTEANIQAAWIYRNYFVKEHWAHHSEIVLLSSEDTHYSVVKAANLLGLKWYSVAVHDDTRALDRNALEQTVTEAIAKGARCFIVFSNMATTMFGSVDDPDVYARCLEARNMPYRIHVDGAFGGFIYPVSDPGNHVCFRNPVVSSITLDAHKMLQAPYGTGIFITRKGLMEYVMTEEASYVHGMDITLSGSRAGVNAIAVWMILFTYGPYGWLEKINKLLYRTDWLCQRLTELGIAYYRHPAMNIVAIRAGHISPALAQRFLLVPDCHEGEPSWYKIVVMNHVEIDVLEQFIAALS